VKATPPTSPETVAEKLPAVGPCNSLISIVQRKFVLIATAGKDATTALVVPWALAATEVTAPVGVGRCAVAGSQRGK
jgi:hypothetical protein